MKILAYSLQRESLLKFVLVELQLKDEDTVQDMVKLFYLEVMTEKNEPR